MAQIPNLVNIVSAFIQGAGSLVGADFGPGFCPAPLLDRLQSKGIFVPDYTINQQYADFDIDTDDQFSEYRQRFHSGGGQPGRGRFWVRVLSFAPPKIHGHLQISWICSLLYRCQILQVLTTRPMTTRLYR